VIAGFKKILTDALGIQDEKSKTSSQQQLFLQPGLIDPNLSES